MAGCLFSYLPTKHTAPMYIIMPPARRINRRRPSAARRALTRAAQVAALLATTYALAYLITTAVMI